MYVRFLTICIWRNICPFTNAELYPTRRGAECNADVAQYDQRVADEQYLLKPRACIKDRCSRQEKTDCRPQSPFELDREKCVERL